MAVKVHLDFVPPTRPDITKLHILESAVQGGLFVEIEVVTNIGAYPDYITEYTTVNAAAENNWFAIQWEDAKGDLSDLSTPVQGGTETLVGEIVRKVMIRDPDLDENVVAQEAEAAIQQFFNVADPYSLFANYGTYTQRLGLVYLSLARALMSSVLLRSASESSSYTAGLVSQKSGADSAQISGVVDALLKQANIRLGTSYTIIMLLEDIDPTGIGATSSIDWDASRAMVTFLDG